MISADIQEYNSKLDDSHREIAQCLCDLISKSLPSAEGKVWHGHPVWFIDGNPIAGYSLKKSGIEVLFWSGKSFATAGLHPVGTYQAAGIAVETADAVDKIKPFMAEAQSIQWNYKDLPKLRKLEKLTSF
jgi:hypothetical protein